MSEMVNMVNGFKSKSSKFLCSSDHPILFKMVNIVIKELQIVFWNSTVININRNMEELERKIQCEKSDRIFHVTVGNADVGGLRCHL